MLLTYLMVNMEIFTPDLFHFVTCFEEIYGHYLWIFILWSIFKCFFLPSENTTYSYKADIFFNSAEFILGLLLSWDFTLGSLAVFSFGFLILILRNLYPRIMTLGLVIFLFLYLC